MRDECLNLINTKIDTNIETKTLTLTENLKVWRKYRNITKADYLVFVGNILEELLEPLWKKEAIEDMKQEILNGYFFGNFEINEQLKQDDIIDAIQDIQVFCINETELMGYDNLKCNNEVFQEINSREQDPQQFAEWQKYGAKGKWQKNKHQKDWTLYKANYESCKL